MTCCKTYTFCRMCTILLCAQRNLHTLLICSRDMARHWVQYVHCHQADCCSCGQVWQWACYCAVLLLLLCEFLWFTVQSIVTVKCELHQCYITDDIRIYERDFSVIVRQQCETSVFARFAWYVDGACTRTPVQCCGRLLHRVSKKCLPLNLLQLETWIGIHNIWHTISW